MCAHVGWFGGCAGGHAEVTGLGPAGDDAEPVRLSLVR